MTAISILTMSNRKGRATTVGLGSTGAPGDDNTVCQSCHNGPTDIEVKIFVLDQADTITKYEANKTYQIHVRVNHAGGNVPKAHGFQMTLLKAIKGQNGENLKDITPISQNVKLVTIRNGRLYAEQTDRSATNLFEVQWKAPLPGSGPITIYAGGTGVNSNDSDSGDGGSRTSLQVDEALPSSADNTGINKVSIFPNPFVDKFYIQGNLEDVKELEIMNLFGSSVGYFKLYESNRTIDLSNLNDGIYFAKFINHQNKILKTQKLIKKTQRP